MTGSRAAGGCLIAAAVLFWLAWLLMPGVGVTDARWILQHVADHRTAVMASVLVQLLSAILYVPALVGIATGAFGDVPAGPARGPAAVLLLGAMGSAADAVYHLLAYAMTEPGVDPAAQVPVMRFMQGPGLLPIAPLLLCFFVGSVWMSVAFARAGAVSRWNPRLFLVALGVAVLGGVLAAQGVLERRWIGLSVLALVVAAQCWLGASMSRTTERGP